MSYKLLVALATLLCLPLVHAAPPLERRQDITTLSSSQITPFRPYTWYAAAAHCPSVQTENWSCGPNCQANPTFRPVASGGDGNVTQYWFVGYDPTLQTVIVAHQGTNTSELLPVLTDLDLVRTPLESDNFPGISSSIEVHDGFKNAQNRSAAPILTAVQTTISTYNTTNVTIIGHSLGAAVALLDAVYLPLHIPNATYRTIGYGMPRVGNQEFANYVDANVTALTRINNKEDPVPVVPGRFLGYHHPSGEVHINDDGNWDACPGQDDPSVLCSTGDVTNVFDSNESDHDGPYDGIELVCQS